MLDINDLRGYYNSIVHTMHVLERCYQRNISPDDIEHAIVVGEIIEQYPDDFPNPSCLIFGYTESNKPIHIVIGSDGNCAKIITAYFPSAEKFEDDLKTRKGASK